jgi:hypothetical protein
VADPAYANNYENLAFTRDDGVLVLRFHTNGGPRGRPHRFGAGDVR